MLTLQEDEVDWCIEASDPALQHALAVIQAKGDSMQPLLDCILYLTRYLYDPGTFTKLCKPVHPWERVSAIQSIKAR